MYKFTVRKVKALWKVVPPGIKVVFHSHYNDVIMTTMASQITSITFVYSTVYSDSKSKKSSKLRVTGLCVGNSPRLVNCPHKWPVTRKMFPFDDVIMIRAKWSLFCRRRFQMHFLQQIDDFDSNITEFHFLVPKWQLVNINPDYGLAPNKRQAVTWWNIDPHLERHRAWRPQWFILGKNLQNSFRDEFVLVLFLKLINSLRPRDAYMRRQSNHHWFR